MVYESPSIRQGCCWYEKSVRADLCWLRLRSRFAQGTTSGDRTRLRASKRLTAHGQGLCSLTFAIRSQEAPSLPAVPGAASLLSAERSAG